MGYTDMEMVMCENERAHLLSIYFDISRRDNDTTMGRKEYRRFIGRLNASTREKFELRGGFESMDVDKNGAVNLQEFQNTVDVVIGELNEEHMSLLRQRSKF